jgi:hypothetical protein
VHSWNFRDHAILQLLSRMKIDALGASHPSPKGQSEMRIAAVYGSFVLQLIQQFAWVKGSCSKVY